MSASLTNDLLKKEKDDLEEISSELELIELEGEENVP
jgi:hypothetical protein